MGSNDGWQSEKPVYRVTLSSFYIGKYPVTQKEGQDVMGSDPSYFKGEDLPVQEVAWFDAIDFFNKPSIKEGLIPVL